jgi:general secretion pathway protein L
MKLRVFLPPSERLDAVQRVHWMLFDARRNLLREDTSPLADIPRAEDVEAVLPASRVLFARLKLPKVSAATIREILPYAVEDRLLADPAHIHAVAGATDARGETLVAVIDREWLRGMLGVLAEAGLRPRRGWCESALLAGGHADWHVVLGPERGMLVDDQGVGVTFDRSAVSGFPLALRIALDEASARGDRPASIRVHHEHGEALPDLARWSAETGVAFEPGTEWEILAREEPAAGSIDLLTEEFAPRRGRLSGARVPRAAIVLALAIAVLQLAFVAADTWRLARERTALEARRDAIFRDAFPEAKVVVDPDLQMARNLAELQRARGLAADDDFLAALTRAGREAPPHATLPGGPQPARSIEYANGKLVVSRGGRPGSAAWGGPPGSAAWGGPRVAGVER